MKKWFALASLLWCPSLFAQENQSLLFPEYYAEIAWSDTVTISPVKIAKSGAKSENHAFNLSLWCTVLPTVTLIGSPFGLIAGPSMGYFYGGSPGRGWLGMGIRTVGIGGMISSFAICGWDCSQGDPGYTWAWIVFVTGGAIVAGDAIYDIATVKKAVRNHNAKLQKNGWRLTPVYFSKHKAPGLELRLNF